MRFLTPLVLFVAAAAVHGYNLRNAGTSVVYFPLLDKVFPSLAGHLDKQGQASVLILSAVGGLSLLRAIVPRRRTETDDDS